LTSHDAAQKPTEKRPTSPKSPDLGKDKAHEKQWTWQLILWISTALRGGNTTNAWEVSGWSYAEAVFFI